MWFGEPSPFPERGSITYHWARQDNKVTKGDRVEVVLITSYEVLISRYEHAQHGILKNIFTNSSWRYVRWLCWIIRALQSRMLHEGSKSSGKKCAKYYIQNN